MGRVFAPEGGGRTLGEAANRYVTFQMMVAGVGIVLFLLFLFFFFLPMWNNMTSMWNSFPGP